MSADIGPDVRVYESIDDVSRAAAEVVVACSERARSSPRRTSAIALSGGSTPKGLFKILASSGRQRIDWSSLHLFWTDERCVPPDDRNSNFGLFSSLVLAKVAVPAENIHRVRGEAGPERGAGEYEEVLYSFFGRNTVPVFDLVILGVGADGHTASLFPGSPALRERSRLVLPVLREPPDLNRVTLTLSVLNHAAQILYLVSGRAKAGIVHEILEDGNPKGCPAGMVRPERCTITWMLDRDAAGLLSGIPVRHSS